jgi:glycosyltransferase involved in cell wall biosynthesis
VIISGLDWIREIVVDEQTGKIIRPGSPEGLAEKVLWVLNHPQNTKQMVTAAYKGVQEKYDISRCGDLLKTFLTSK